VVLVPQSQIYHLARAASRQRFTHSMLHFYQSKVRFVYKHHGPVQASFMRKILWMKAAIWCRRPQGSPLRTAYPDLPDEQIVAAYRRLREALALPLSDYLVQDWQ
jgi:GT2 family glycosyltransferase